MQKESTSAPPRWIKDWERRQHSPWPTHPPMPPVSANGHRFTLTELLVAIGILALLMGLTVKGVKKMREAAREADRLNHATHVQHP